MQIAGLDKYFSSNEDTSGTNAGELLKFSRTVRDDLGPRSYVLGDITMESVERPVVLVVDDTQLNLILLTRILEKDYTILSARSGKEALDTAFANPPDLILLDIMMPEMDGFEVCRRLKDNPSTTHVPVIFITAKNEVEDEERGFSLGAADFIHKPISPPIVSARVRTHLKIKFMQDYLLYENSLLQKDVKQQSMELEHIREFIWSIQNPH